MVGGGGERGEVGASSVPLGVKSRDCFTGSESARRNGELETDFETWTATRLGVNID